MLHGSSLFSSAFWTPVQPLLPGMLLILLSMLDTVQPASLVRPRYAVFGGSGFIGSRVCKTLVEAGCSVASISRTGKCPEWATEEPWSAQVNWLTADMLSPPGQLAAELGAIDGAVSCVGNMRPSPTWRDFFGLHGTTNRSHVRMASSRGASARARVPQGPRGW